MADESISETGAESFSSNELLYSGFDISTVINPNIDRDATANDDVNIIDRDWVLSRFMMSDDELSELDAANRYFTTTAYKFSDTSLGGNIAINARPQFTRYCDIRSSSRINRTDVTVTGTSGNFGMGRYYSEAIDDNAQTIYMTFGVPKFNSLVNFFTRAIDYTDSVIANTGRAPVGYTVGQGLGAGIMLMAFPMITLSIWAFKLTSKFLLGSNEFDYYYMEPTMHMYWGSVNTIVTTLATEMGILIPELMNDGTVANRMGLPVKIDQEDMTAMRKMFPMLISNDNYIDVFAIAARPQMIANQQYYKERAMYEEDPSGDFDFIGYVKKDSSTKENSTSSGFIAGLNKALSFENFLKKVVADPENGTEGVYNNRANDDKTATAPQSTTDVDKSSKFTKDDKGSYDIPVDTEKETYLDKLTSALDSSIRDGGMHAVFNVDYTGPVSESFTNSVGNIGMGDKIKGMSNAARNVKFDLAGGNITDTIKGVVDAAKSVVAGTLDSISFGLSSVVGTITGGGFIDIPKKWEDSDMSLPSITYNMQLISPYGNVISQFQNIYIPLAMVLAGALPQAAGMSSYTSPYLCSLFCKGVQNIKMGMITNLTITRGTSNLGFTKTKRPLAIDVSFTVTDFSTRITAPVTSSIFGAFGVALNDNTPLGNYLATLGSRDILTSKYTVPKIKLRASRLLMTFDQMISPASFGVRMGAGGLNNVLGGLLADHNVNLTQQNK